MRLVSYMGRIRYFYQNMNDQGRVLNIKRKIGGQSRRFKKKDNRKLFSVELDIPFNDRIILKQRFDWDLSKENISPTEFVRRLCVELGIQREQTRLRKQLIQQIIDQMRRPVVFKQVSQQSQDQQANKEEENEKKKISRMRRNQILKRVQTEVPVSAKLQTEVTKCSNCNSDNNPNNPQCKQCLIPLYLLDELDLTRGAVRICLKFYERLVSKIPLLKHQARGRIFQQEDFSHLSRLYHKIINVVLSSKDVCPQTIFRVKYLMRFHQGQLLKGHVQANHPFWNTYQSPKAAVNKVRRRGRPKRIDVFWQQEREEQSQNEDEYFNCQLEDK